MNRAMRPISLLLLIMVAAPVAVQGQVSGNPDGNYGRTPDDLVPFRGFQTPHISFFAERQPFLGTGRNTLPPHDLSSIRIGILAPLDASSSESIMGRRMLQGAQLALEEANARGGYRGLPYEFAIRDDVGPWGSSSNKFVELADEGVWAVFGSIDGQNTHIALRVALKFEIPMVTSGSTDPTLTETRIPWYVRVNADDRQISYALASYVFHELGLSRVAMLRANTRYGRVGVGEFKDAARRLKKPLLLEMRYGSGDADFTAQLERIRAARPEAVVLWGDAAEMARIVRQMREMGMDQLVLGPDRLLAPEFVRAAGAHGAGVVGVDLWHPERQDARLRAFEARYRERFSEDAEAMAAHAYDGMNLLIQAIQTVGPNKTLIRDWLSGQTRYHGITGEIPFDATLNDVGPVYLARFENGRFAYFAESMNGTLTFMDAQAKPSPGDVR